MGGADERTVAVLVGGGIDSSVLTVELCDTHAAVFPLFVRGGLSWEEHELAHLRDFLRAIARPELRPLIVLEQPVRDVYGEHWSITGSEVPDAHSDDEAVYLPGRNLFLLSKAAVWCVLKRVHTLALAPLESNPFADATPEFYAGMETLVQQALQARLVIVRPYAALTKADVIRRGARLPLERTSSCLKPTRGLHCGACNKCAERRRGFQEAGVPDRTEYAS
jgi:7-cyano-7-deazaguanine synthase